MDDFISKISFDSLVLIGLTLAMVVLFYVGRRILRRRVEDGTDNFLLLLFRHLNAPVHIGLLLTAIFVIARHLPFRLPEYDWSEKAYSLALIALVSWIGLRVIHLTSDLIMRRFNVGVPDNLEARRVHTQVQVAGRLASAIVIIIALASALMMFEQIRALGVSLIASAGVAGIVLGLAAQKTIGNFFTGLQIAITQPIRLGDAVIVENEWGTIEEINLTYVVVKIWDLRRLVLPISYFVEKPFQNWTRQSANLLGAVTLYLDYKMPVDKLRAELDRILGDTDLWDGKVKVVQVIDATEKTMQIRVLVSAQDAPKAWDLRCFVRERLIAFIQENYPECLPRVRAAVDSDNLPRHTGNGKGRGDAATKRLETPSEV